MSATPVHQRQIEEQVESIRAETRVISMKSAWGATVETFRLSTIAVESAPSNRLRNVARTLRIVMR